MLQSVPILWRPFPKNTPQEVADLAPTLVNFASTSFGNAAETPLIQQYEALRQQTIACSPRPIQWAMQWNGDSVAPMANDPWVTVPESDWLLTVSRAEWDAQYQLFESMGRPLTLYHRIDQQKWNALVVPLFATGRYPALYGWQTANATIVSNAILDLRKPEVLDAMVEDGVRIVRKFSLDYLMPQTKWGFYEPGSGWGPVGRPGSTPDGGVLTGGTLHTTPYRSGEWAHKQNRLFLGLQAAGVRCCVNELTDFTKGKNAWCNPRVMARAKNVDVWSHP